MTYFFLYTVYIYTYSYTNIISPVHSTGAPKIRFTWESYRLSRIIRLYSVPLWCSLLILVTIYFNRYSCTSFLMFFIEQTLSAFKVNSE